MTEQYQSHYQLNFLRFENKFLFLLHDPTNNNQKQSNVISGLTEEKEF